MSGLVESLASKKERAVRHKREVEERWIEDERQYWGFRQPIRVEEDEDEEAPPIDNITQAKVDIAAARIQDMLFPTNDKNWSLKATPEPTDIDGNPIDPEQAEQAVDRCEQKIDDYLTESQYSKHGRAAIFDACKLGPGIIKGPVARSSTRRVVRRNMMPVTDEMGQPVIDPETGAPAQQAEVSLQIVQETKPGSSRVDPWMWFPLPCRNMDECEGAFELHQYGKAKLVSMAKWPGFDEDQIRELAQREPRRTENETALMQSRRTLLRANAEPPNEYFVWEYHGPIGTQWLQRMGYDVGDDPLEMYYGEVWFCDGHLLKVDLNAILGDERVPYHVFCYKRDDADILNAWGIPRVIRDEQRTVDITYEAIQYNSALCSGPQWIYFDGRAIPADGKYRINGPKGWKITNPRVQKIEDVIQFQNIPSVVGDLIPVYRLAKANADENTQLPMMAQGEASNVQMTASGQAMVMNAQNVVQRRSSHSWDDDVTVPHITRYYWWEMEFGDDDSIKVEMEVDARGSSYLLVKDQQAQHGLFALQLLSSDQEIAQEIDRVQLYKDVLNVLDFPTDKLWKTEEQKQQEAQSPQAQAQAEMADAERRKLMAEADEAEAKAQQAQIESQSGQQDGQQGWFEFEKAQLEDLQHQRDTEAKLVIAQMERDGRLAVAASQEGIKLADIQARLQTSEQDAAIKKMIEDARLAQKERADERANYLKGFEAQVNLRRERLRDQNLRQGWDSF